MWLPRKITDHPIGFGNEEIGGGEVPLPAHCLTTACSDTEIRVDSGSWQQDSGGESDTDCGYVGGSDPSSDAFNQFSVLRRPKPDRGGQSNGLLAAHCGKSAWVQFRADPIAHPCAMADGCGTQETGGRVDAGDDDRPAIDDQSEQYVELPGPADELISAVDRVGNPAAS